MLRDVFNELAERVEAIATKAEGDAFLGDMRERYGLKNVAYLGVNIPGKSDDGTVYVTTTYTAEWHARYMSKDYAKIDPVVRRGLMRCAPLDWDDAPRDSKVVRVMFGEAREHGVGERGLTIPIRGAHGEIALFSVNVDLNPTSWSTFKRQFIRDFQVISHQFHEHVLRREKVIAPDIRLTQRQIEILKWVAEGKTDWETSQILGLSEHSVRYHVEGAGARLGAVNRVHTLVKAARLHLV